PNLIALPGERRGMSREEGADNAVEILSRVASYAEEKNVVLCMEITNSKVAADNRTDQVFDDIHWGFDVCRRTGSPNVQVVYDIYHVQIANGDVVRTMRENLDLCCHVHVAGVPSRAEIDSSELDYRYIAREIVDMGYEGFVAQEYNPSPGRNPLISLAVGYDILTVTSARSRHGERIDRRNGGAQPIAVSTAVTANAPAVQRRFSSCRS